MKIEQILQASIARLLKPLVRLLLRNGISYGVFADIAKRIFVEVALEDGSLPGRKTTVSRASVLTGLSRKEIARIQKLPRVSDTHIQDRYNRAARVITGWMRDESFTDAAGNPKALPIEGGEGSFSQLVRKYSGDVPVRAILDELTRVGTVEQIDTDTIGLRTQGYVPASGETEKLAILGTDVSDLIETIDHNLGHTGPDSRFQMKVAYDNLPEEALAGFRALSSQQSLGLLKKFDRELSAQDRDDTPDAAGSGRFRAGISIYYFEENLSQEMNGEVK